MAEIRPSGTVLVLADDLIWASRLMAAVQRAGAIAVRLSSAAELEAALAADAGAELDAADERRVAGVVVDLNGRRYEGAAAVARAVAAAKPVIAAAQHDDQPTRRLALDAGAQRVFSYAKMHSDGEGVVRRWLGAS
ncbi:hypothetical protein BH18CHL1_BH18CHL1_04590 [soil metagenome]